MITSLDNKKVKEVCKLNIKKNRKELGLFVVETEHLVMEAEKNNLLLYTLGTKEYNYKNFELVSEAVMKKMTNLESVPSIMGVCKMIPEKSVNGNVLILDNIQDPGNLGTIIRSACAFDIDTIVLSPNTVDLYNYKVLRSTEGMIFNINIITRDLEEYIPKLKEKNYKIYGTDVISGTLLKNVEKHNNYAIIMGNEGAGVSAKIKNLCDENIYINMNSKCESLNVSVAASIILYEFKR